MAGILADFVSVAESMFGAPSAANLVNDALNVVETVAPPPVTAGINTVKSFLGTPLGEEIEAALLSFMTSITTPGAAVVAEPVVQNVNSPKLAGGGT